MANHKSSKKRILITEKRRKVNVQKKSATKTAVKKAALAIKSKDMAAIKPALRAAESKLMKSKIMPKKRASRKVSRLAKAANKVK
jgi:small subunit ribosomal protein S20